MTWKRLFIVAEGVLGVGAVDVTAWFGNLVGNAVRYLDVTDDDLERVRAGGTVYRTCAVPSYEFSEGFRDFIRGGADRVRVALRIGPWMRVTGTQTVTDANGEVIDVPVAERVGTLFDLLFDDEDVDVDALEGYLTNMFARGTIRRSDGTEVPVLVADIGLKLVPASEVLTPSIVFPVWTLPEVVDDPALINGTL